MDKKILIVGSQPNETAALSLLLSKLRADSANINIVENLSEVRVFIGKNPELNVDLVFIFVESTHAMIGIAELIQDVHPTHKAMEFILIGNLESISNDQSYRRKTGDETRVMSRRFLQDGVEALSSSLTATKIKLRM